MTMPLVRDNAIARSSARCMALALYDNMADSQDELAFRKGDLLTVLEQNTAGIEGWWLCSLRGRQGTCPGNRLRLLAGVYDTGGSPPSPVRTPAPAAALAGRPLPPPPHSASQHSLHKGHSRRRSWNTQPNKVNLPHRVGDQYIYEQPQTLYPSPSPSQTHISLHQSQITSPRTHTPPHQTHIPLGHSLHGQAVQGGMETYDVPRSVAVPATYDAPRSLVPRHQNHAVQPSATPGQDWYDVPRAPCLTLLHQQQLTPSSSAGSLTMDSMSSSNRSSLANMPDYDIPRSRGSNYTSSTLRNQSPNLSQTYDVPPPNPQPKELPLEWTEALDMLERLQSEATDAISRLLGFVRPGWRSHSAMSNQLLDVRLGSLRLRAALHDLAQFTEGTLGNAANAHDKGLAIKLRPLVKALRDADRLVNEVIENLDALNWSIELLCRPDDAKEDTTNNSIPDALDQLIACARALTEDVRQTASFIQGNSTLLFKKSKSLQMKGNGGVGEWVEEYDYVKLESRENVDKKHAEIKDSLPNELKKSFENVIKDADYPTTNIQLSDPNDKTLVLYYAKQTITYFNYLTTAIDAFLQTVERNQPPAVFLAHGKFVVLNAHRLVYIGDTVHRNIENTEFKSKVLHCSNSLSDGLAMTVAKAKNAALNFPSVSAVQEMVDSVVDVSNSARDLKICMIQTASQP